MLFRGVSTKSDATMSLGDFDERDSTPSSSSTLAVRSCEISLSERILAMLGFDLMKFLRFSVLGVRGVGVGVDCLGGGSVAGGFGGGGGGGHMVPFMTRAAVFSDIRDFSLLQGAGEEWGGRWGEGRGGGALRVTLVFRTIMFPSRLISPSSLF